MISFLVLIVSLLPTPSQCNFWNLPTNIKFDINLYKDSLCTESYNNNTELIFYCNDGSNIEGCCYDSLTKLAPIYNPQLNVCYDINTNNNDSFVEYNCNEANMSDMTSVEIFGFIGIILMIILGSALVYYILRIVCCRNRTGTYSEL